MSRNEQLVEGENSLAATLVGHGTKSRFRSVSNSRRKLCVPRHHWRDTSPPGQSARLWESERMVMPLCGVCDFGRTLNFAVEISGVQTVDVGSPFLVCE